MWIVGFLVFGLLAVTLFGVYDLRKVSLTPDTPFAYR